jgi:methyl-accepting chemotaxis protein
MSDEKSPRRLLSLLRRRPKVAEGARDSNTLWLAYERALLGVRQMTEANQSLSATLARQRSIIDSGVDRVRAAHARTDELRSELRGIADALDKLLVLSMNASLEGARQGEGSPLQLIGEEVRSHARRGLDALEELRTSTRELGVSADEILRLLEQSKEASVSLFSDVGRAGTAASSVERTLGEVRDALRRTTGTDPETMKVLGEASEHAKALVTSLSTLSGKLPKSLIASVLRPTIEPLLSMLVGDDEDAVP